MLFLKPFDKKFLAITQKINTGRRVKVFLNFLRDKKFETQTQLLLKKYRTHIFLKVRHVGVTGRSKLVTHKIQEKSLLVTQRIQILRVHNNNPINH